MKLLIIGCADDTTLDKAIVMVDENNMNLDSVMEEVYASTDIQAAAIMAEVDPLPREVSQILDEGMLYIG